jgi:hypothetical protein
MADENGELYWQIEEACYRAWPSLEEERTHGWVLRYANGTGRRVNSRACCSQEYAVSYP